MTKDLLKGSLDPQLEASAPQLEGFQSLLDRNFMRTTLYVIFSWLHIGLQDIFRGGRSKTVISCPGIELIMNFP